MLFYFNLFYYDMCGCVGRADHEAISRAATNIYLKKKKKNSTQKCCSILFYIIFLLYYYYYYVDKKKGEEDAANQERRAIIFGVFSLGRRIGCSGYYLIQTILPKFL